MLIAEDLLLLGLDPVRGRPVLRRRQELLAGLAGALVAELSIGGFVDLSGKRMVVLGGEPSHPLLASVLRVLAKPNRKRSPRQLGQVEDDIDLWPRLVDGLIQEQVLGRRVDRVLGISVTRHPVLAVDLRLAVLHEVGAAAAQDGPLDPRTAVLLGLSGPCRLLPVIAPDPATRPHARSRIKEATALSPVVRIVEKLITSQQSDAG